MLDKARRRVRTLTGLGYSNATIYGENELGGLHTIYVLTDRPSVYGLPEDPQVPTTTVLGQWLGGVITAAGLAVLPFWLLFRRRKRLEAERQSREGGAK